MFTSEKKQSFLALLEFMRALSPIQQRELNQRPEPWIDAFREQVLAPVLFHCPFLLFIEKKIHRNFQIFFLFGKTGGLGWESKWKSEACD